MILAPHLRNTSPWLSEFARLFDTATRYRRSAPENLRVRQDESGWTLELEFPGVARDALELELKENALYLHVKSEDETTSDFRLPLGQHIDATSISSRLEDGLLSVRLPKRVDATETTKIEIL